MQILLLLERTGANDNPEVKVACKFICLGSFKKKQFETDQGGEDVEMRITFTKKQQSNVI